MRIRAPVFFSDLFGITFIAGWAAGLVVALFVSIWMSMLSGFHVFHIVLGIGVAAIAAILFQTVMLPLLFCLNIVRMRFEAALPALAYWVLLPFYGAGIGVLLSVLLIYPSDQTSVIGATGGLTAGFVSAFLWNHVVIFRSKFPRDENGKGRVLYVPTWISKQDK